MSENDENVEAEILTTTASRGCSGANESCMIISSKTSFSGSPHKLSQVADDETAIMIHDTTTTNGDDNTNDNHVRQLPTQLPKNSIPRCCFCCGCNVNWKSWISNILFLTGSSLYVWQAILDLLAEKQIGDEDDDKSEYETLKFILPSKYMMVSSFAALSFLLDAILQASTIQFAIPHLVVSQDVDGNDDQQQHGHLLHHIRYYAAEIGGVFSFGIAAALDLMAALLDNNWLTFGAVHCYLLNASILFAGKTWSANETIADKIQCVGDILFVTGCVIDVSLSYFFNTETSNFTWKFVNRGNLLSSVLWLLDAILYIIVDLIDTIKNENDHHYDDHEEDHTDELGESSSSSYVAPLLNGISKTENISENVESVL